MVLIITITLIGRRGVEDHERSTAGGRGCKEIIIGPESRYPRYVGIRIWIFPDVFITEKPARIRLPKGGVANVPWHEKYISDARDKWLGRIRKTGIPVGKRRDVGGLKEASCLCTNVL